MVAKIKKGKKYRNKVCNKQSARHRIINANDAQSCVHSEW